MSSALPAIIEHKSALVEILKPHDDEMVVHYVGRLMEMLQPPDEDAVDKIAATILVADSMEAENSMWDTTGSAKCIGRRYRFHSAHIQASDYPDAPLPWFLVCPVTDLDTGEATILTTGSVNICTSLAKAYLLGRLPADAEIIGPKRQPKNGRVPLHLKWIIRSAPGGA